MDSENTPSIAFITCPPVHWADACDYLWEDSETRCAARARDEEVDEEPEIG